MFLYYYKLLTMRRCAGREGHRLHLLGAFPKELPLRYRYPMPTIEEQAAIAEVLSDMDAELGALEARRAKTALLKQGMMQELLTGRARLVREIHNERSHACQH